MTSDHIEVYRSFPKMIKHPRKNRFLTLDDFNGIDKQEMESVSSLCDGHEGTIVWYTKSGYIAQIKFRARSDVYVLTPCTFIPTFGVDKVDGMFIQDTEEYVLEKVLGRSTDRLMIFDDRDEIGMQEYLASRSLVVTKRAQEKFSLKKYIKKITSFIFKKKI